MKKTIIVTFIAVITVIAGYNIYTSQTSENLSSLMLANIEALANDGEDDKGVQSIIIEDLGNDTECINNVRYSIVSYRVNCIGKGSLPCTGGVYSKYTRMGECHLT